MSMVEKVGELIYEAKDRAPCHHMKAHYPLSPLTVRRYAFLFRLTQLQTISYPVAGPTCPPTQHLPVPHCAPVPFPAEPATSVPAWLMSLVTGLWPFSLPQGHLSLPPTSQSTTWIVNMSLTKHSILSKESVLWLWTRTSPPPPRKSPHSLSQTQGLFSWWNSLFPQHTLGVSKDSLNSLYFIALYVIDVYHHVSPNKLPPPLRQWLCPTSSIFLVPNRVSGTLVDIQY